MPFQGSLSSANARICLLRRYRLPTTSGSSGILVVLITVLILVYFSECAATYLPTDMHRLQKLQSSGLCYCLGSLGG